MIHQFSNSLLVLGGARSGKSRFAQMQAESLTGDLVYVATAQALDAEMEERIASHRRDRGPRWRTVEAPLDLVSTIARESQQGTVLLVDCLTLWISNLIFADRDIGTDLEDLTSVLRSARGKIILVSNEVGLGIVPDNALARRFRDAAGETNQAVAQAVDAAVFVAASLPLVLK